MKSLKQLLTEIDACNEAIEWAGDKTIEQAVDECHRGDWMLWLAAKIGVDHRKLTLAKGHCANTVRELMQDQRSIHAVDTAISYGEGNATKKELNVAADAAYAATTATTAYAAYAAYAAYSAAASVRAAAAFAASVAAYPATPHAAYAAASASASSAATAAYVAVSADNVAVSASSAAYAARKENRMQTADICRKYIGNDIIEKVNMLINKPVNN